MKNKILTILLGIMIILTPLGYLPNSLVTNLPKLIILYSFSSILLIYLIYKWIKDKKIEYEKTDILLLMFLILALFSTIFSVKPINSIIGAQNRYEGLITLIIYSLIYYLAKYYVDYPKKLIFIFFIEAAVFSTLEILQFYQLDFIVNFFGPEKRSGNFFDNPIFFASYINLFLPLVIYLYITKLKTSYLLFSLLYFSAMICSLTRAVWLAFGFYFLLIIIIFIKKQKAYKQIIALTLCFFLIFLIINKTNQNLSGKLDDVYNDIKTISQDGLSEELGSNRIRIWRLSYEIAKRYPLLGCGIDSLEFGIKEKFLPIVEESGNRAFDKAHNEPLQIMSTIGIPAVIIYLTFIIFNIKQKFTILTFPIIGYLIQGLFGISTIGVAPFFWLFLGLNQNKQFKYRLKKELIILNKPPRFILEIIIIFLILSLIFVPPKNINFNYKIDSKNLDITIHTVGLIKTGPKAQDALNYVIELGKKLKFPIVKNINNEVGYIEFGHGKDMIGIFTHLDVADVQEGWTYPPFGGIIKDNKIYGRGAIDDRGPTIAALYAMKAVMDSNVKLNKRVRLIFTTDEENNTNQSLITYLLNEEKPIYGFIADAEFPVLYKEQTQNGSWEIDINSEIVQRLIKIYNNYNKTDLKPFATTAGRTFANYLENVVGFGAIFPGEKLMNHQIDEYINISSLIKASKIYAQAIYELAK